MAHRPHILIIDDNQDHLELLRLALGLRFQITTASDGLDGYAEACQIRPAAILLDVMMPVVDGYTVLRKLRANPATKNIPIIIVTALDPESVDESVRVWGVTTILRKPCHAGEILQALEDALVSSRSE